MRIIEAVIIIDNTVGTARSITEQHTYDTGDVVPFSYQTDTSLDVNLAMQLRVEKINAQLAARDEAELAANNYEVPINQAQFLDIIPASLRKTLRERAKLDADLDDALERMKASTIFFKTATAMWLDNLVSMSSMTQAERDQIIASWTAAYG